MPLVINTNVPSLEAQRNLNKSHKILNRSFQRLSSGFRINNASDDAAGLGISETLRARIKSLQVAERNTSSGLAMAQTAEGGLGEISNVIIRLREIAVQGANGDLTSTDRSYLDTEFQALVSEVDRLAETTDYNDIELLAGTGTVDVAFQVGINATPSDVITATFGGVTTSTLGLSGVSVAGATPANSTTALGALDGALTSVSTDRARNGALTNRLAIAIANSQTMRANLEAANSSIRDVDVAEETSTLARAQVLLEAGVSVLSQANQVPSLSLSLLS